jgi:hypothetical protein
MSERWRKILVGLGLGVAGAVLTYLGEWATGLDLGVWQPLVAAGIAALLNVVRKHEAEIRSAPEAVAQLVRGDTDAE